MTLSVSELNEYVRKSLASDPIIQNVTVKGEISNFKSYASGHWYFTLKDADASISCVMFSQYNCNLDFMLTDGMAVELIGNISLYVKTGQYQFYIKSASKSGQGALYKQFEELKSKLIKEGLFDESLKKQLPLFAKCIGVISSGSGAVIHDIINVATMRNALVSVLLYPSKVQGSGTAENVIEGIEYFNSAKNVDLIIVARGGGSFEDLFEFNNEKLARVARKSSLPIISAIGHETDFTILDFVSDVRAATPSQAAEIAVIQQKYLLNQLNEFNNRANKVLQDIIQNYKNRLERCRLVLIALLASIDSYSLKLNNLQNKINLIFSKTVLEKKMKLRILSSKIEVLNPEYVINRGYAVIIKDGHLISNIHNISINDILTVKLSDGEIVTSVKEVYNGKKNKNF